MDKLIQRIHSIFELRLGRLTHSLALKQRDDIDKRPNINFTIKNYAHRTSMKSIKATIFILITCIAFGCNKPAASGGNTGGGGGNNPPADTAQIAKGADVSWVSQMEAGGIKFFDSAGMQENCLQILKNIGINSIRLRAWVNPIEGWNNTADVVKKALTAQALGMKVLIDFHYSDTWADPGHQAKPTAWASQNFATLKQSLANYTTGVLDTLKLNGITPTWVQLGNETNDGMLWPDGQASVNMSGFAQLITAGYNAVKAVDTSIKVIVHLSNGYDNTLFRWLFDGLKNNGGKWDIIGMSLYPTASNWQTLNTQCLANMNDMVARYSTPVMVVETGMSWDQDAACNSFLTDLINKVKSVANSNGLGVFYWEPESYNNWQGYTLGAFDNSGKPTIALNAFH